MSLCGDLPAMLGLSQTQTSALLVTEAVNRPVLTCRIPSGVAAGTALFLKGTAKTARVCEHWSWGL